MRKVGTLLLVLLVWPTFWIGLMTWADVIEWWVLIPLALAWIVGGLAAWLGR